jgi:hypothetical protein
VQNDRLVLRPDPVDAAETLDQADGVPVKVIVQDTIAVLEVLALAHHIGGEKNPDLGFVKLLLRS